MLRGRQLAQPAKSNNWLGTLRWVRLGQRLKSPDNPEIRVRGSDEGKPLRLTVFMRRIEGRCEPGRKWRIVDLTPEPVSVRDGLRWPPLETPGIYRRYPFDIKRTRTIRRNRCQTAGTAVLSLAILSFILWDRPIAFRSLPVVLFRGRPSPIRLDGGGAREHLVFSRRRRFSLC